VVVEDLVMGDLKSRGWMVAKGVLFALIVVMSGAGVVLDEDRWRRLGLLVTCVWAACRFYYFLFYVLERYVGVEGRYAGILDLVQRLWSARHRVPGSVADHEEKP
jgi:hypothetical protein